MVNPFPLNGVIGIVASHAHELDQALDRQLSCVEIRADLLLEAGYSVSEVLALVSKTQTIRLGCLFTLRHPEHGGKFKGAEADRVEINQAALEAGADIIDLEWGFDATKAMINKGVPIVVSHHDFDGMPDANQLAALTSKIEAVKPAAIKVVPTASTLTQSVQMLKWVNKASAGIRRIGFAMGGQGAFSRILTMVYGAPITYASFGDPVAPGQLSLDALLNRFRVTELGSTTRFYAVAGENASASTVLSEMNQQIQTRHLDALCIPLETSNLEELLLVLADLQIAGVHLEGSLVSAAAEKFSNRHLSTSTSAYLEVSPKQDIRLVPDTDNPWLRRIER